MKLLEGKVALVTGAARGIGKAIALKYAQEGANIAFTDLVIDENGENTKKEIEAYGVKVLAIASNAANFEEAHATVEQVVKEFGRLDILVNNAGIYKGNNFLESDSEVWKKYIDVNILGTIYPTHAILPHMIENGYGRIVNIGSVAGVYGLSYFVDYSMTKGAIISFTKALAKELDPSVGTRVLFSDAVRVI